jgi:hypothetical protein
MGRWFSRIRPNFIDDVYPIDVSKFNIIFLIARFCGLALSVG